jgi:hypothetical protein
MWKEWGLDGEVDSTTIMGVGIKGKEWREWRPMVRSAEIGDLRYEGNTTLYVVPV